MRARWLVLASLSLGGTGIWVMHFIAMLGFQHPRAGNPLRHPADPWPAWPFP
ncbi:MHYT domain-containing protein [Yinghuangia aomiensis]